MYYSYVMGIDDSILKLENQGFVINKDGKNYTVSFPKEKASDWETYIIKCLEVEYWNEYIADDHVVFLFHLQDGIKRYEVYQFDNDEVLELCEQLCDCKFESLKSMLMGNSFYRNIL